MAAQIPVGVGDQTGGRLQRKIVAYLAPPVTVDRGRFHAGAEVV